LCNLCGSVCVGLLVHDLLGDASDMCFIMNPSDDSFVKEHVRSKYLFDMLDVSGPRFPHGMRSRMRKEKGQKSNGTTDAKKTKTCTSQSWHGGVNIMSYRITFNQLIIRGIYVLCYSTAASTP